MKIELLPLALNVVLTLYYLFSRPFETGKLLYWLGATVLTVGVLKMRG